jgi:hypothetical protein
MNGKRDDLTDLSHTIGLRKLTVTSAQRSATVTRFFARLQNWLQKLLQSALSEKLNFYSTFQVQDSPRGFQMLNSREKLRERSLGSLQLFSPAVPAVFRSVVRPREFAVSLQLSS